MTGLFLIPSAIGLVMIYIWLNRLVWMISEKSNAARMDFDQWLDIYAVNPNRWVIRDMNTLDFYYPLYKRDVYMGYLHSDAVCFGFFDSIRYRRWAIRHQKRKEVERKSKYSNDMLIEILNNAQLDIDALRAKAQKEMDEARERIMKGVQDAGNLR